MAQSGANDDWAAPSPSKTRAPVWPTGSASGKWSWSSRKGRISLAAIVLTAVLFVSLTSFGVARAVQDRAASRQNAAVAGVGEVSSTVSDVTSVLSSAGHLVTETSKITSYTTKSATSRFSTSVRASATTSATTSPSAAASAVTAPVYDYAAGHLFGAATNRSKCFPYATPEALSLDSAPSLNRSQWWCEPSLLYGFLGFSYPLEVSASAATLTCVSTWQLVTCWYMLLT